MADSLEEEIRKTQQQRAAQPEGISLSSKISFDEDLYTSKDKSQYATSIAMDDEDGEGDYETSARKSRAAYSISQAMLEDVPASADDDDPFKQHRAQRIIDREDEYRMRRRNRIISPERVDPFALGDKTPDPGLRTYTDALQETQVQSLEQKLKLKVKQAKESGEFIPLVDSSEAKKRKIEEVLALQQKTSAPTNALPAPRASGWDSTATPSRPSRWDAPAGEATPAPDRGGSWNDTPGHSGSKPDAETPRRSRSRWDENPTPSDPAGAATPSNLGALANLSTPQYNAMMGGATPKGGFDMATPNPALIQAMMTPEQVNAMRWEREIDERNRPLSDEELDAMFPTEGYKILEPPANYQPIRTPSRKLLETPTPSGLMGSMYQIPEENRLQYEVPPSPSQLPFIKPEDYQNFGKLLTEVDESELSPEESRDRKISKLLLKVKNGTPPQRKLALRHLTDKAREFGAGPLFNQILPLLMSPSLEDQERHLLVKVIDRVLYKLDDLVRPYVHKILVVIEPLLIDEDYYARVEGREIISNLAKAAGLATMIATLRPDIDNADEYVRNTTARAFAVVASALGIPSLLPFLKAVCQSKKSWQARHTGIKIVQQIAILMGCAVLPHLKNLVSTIKDGLKAEEESKVKTITALALSALAESAAPYGIESFDEVIKPLMDGIKQHRSKTLAAYLKAIGFIIPLMEAEHASFIVDSIHPILTREFASADGEMQKIVLKVVKQCVATDGVDAAKINDKIVPEFFRLFWTSKIAADRRNYKQVVETTVEIANKIGVSAVISRVVENLKDDAEPFRKMVTETVEKVVANLGTADIDQQLLNTLMDGMLFAFQEHNGDDNTILNGLATVLVSLNLRAREYLDQIVAMLRWRLTNKMAKVRQQAADLITRIASVIKNCGSEKLLSHLGQVLYEYLGEEYPEVLGSILAALKAVVNVIGMHKMTPPIKDLLPRLAPILKNRHEKVQENCIDLVGRIADRGSEFVPLREWMRICFELLEMLKAHKKGIRRATVNTFGYIAKAIGPQDVLATLLNNLKVQERQNRVCTTVAIAIVAETCSPFTVLPALMNEYRTPELNVQNGVLKSLSFMFEYIGEMGKDYIYAVAPLLEDALMDRDLVHRQTACTVVKHLALGVAGLGCEDALVHLLNLVWPNIFETSPHVINAVTEAIEGMRVGLGPTTVLQYTVQGLFHPARKVREIYWKIYNPLYIGSQDALIPAYPRLEDDERNTYVRHELDIVL